jgi:hypothetical protein
MKTAIRMLRLTMRQKPVRRGVKRTYNRIAEDFQIVTTRFTEAEYDTLHFVAYSLRVSVSSLIYQMIQLWNKPGRRQKQNTHATNYETFVCNWNQFAGVLTESLLFYPKTLRKNTSIISKPIT